MLSVLTHIYLPLVLFAGDKSRTMYFVRSGSVEISMEDATTGVENIIAEIGSFSDSPFFVS